MGYLKRTFLADTILIMITKEEKQEDFKKVLILPFIKAFSDKVRSDLAKEGVKMVFKKGQTLEKVLCKSCPRVPKELSKDNIYLKNCTACGGKYIGSPVRL